MTAMSFDRIIQAGKCVCKSVKQPSQAEDNKEGVSSGSVVELKTGFHPSFQSAFSMT